MFAKFNNQITTDLDINFEEKPNIPVPKRKVNVINIPGRDGDLIEDEEVYADIIIPVKLNFITFDDFKTKVRKIRNWLLNVTDNKLTFSDDQDYFYKVKLVNCDQIEQQLEELGYFEVNFTCDPFQYLYSGLQTITLKQGISTTIINDGYKSQPYIKFYGNASASIWVLNKNGLKGITVTGNFEEYVEVDSEIMDCFKGTLNCNNLMAGDFPILENGENTIICNGSISKVEIVPRWRYL